MTAKGLHPRNQHDDDYPFPALIKTSPELAKYVIDNGYGSMSINFADPNAVTSLNTALITHFYGVKNWSIPQGALCPPIPGRVDYIHYIAELLDVAEPHSKDKSPSPVKMLDIGTGANGIYSLLASKIYHWQCVASDINTISLQNVEAILKHNPDIKPLVTLIEQPNKHHIFEGVISPEDQFDITVCNPPFHASQKDAIRSNQQKVRNLALRSSKTTQLNFGGSADELWCNGGELLFLKKMIKESAHFKSQCRWFSSLVSNVENIKPALKILKKQAASNIKQLDMKQGNKLTRILAWSYNE